MHSSVKMLFPALHVDFSLVTLLQSHVSNARKKVQWLVNLDSQCLALSLLSLVSSRTGDEYIDTSIVNMPNFLKNETQAQAAHAFTPQNHPYQTLGPYRSTQPMFARHFCGPVSGPPHPASQTQVPGTCEVFRNDLDAALMVETHPTILRNPELVSKKGTMGDYGTSLVAGQVEIARNSRH